MPFTSRPLLLAIVGVHVAASATEAHNVIFLDSFI